MGARTSRSASCPDHFCKRLSCQLRIPPEEDSESETDSESESDSDSDSESESEAEAGPAGR